jgi:integrase
MIQAASGEFKKFLIIAFFAGPRHGEVLGLKRGDLDIENNLIMINKQYNISFMTADAKLKTHKYKPENEIKVPSIIWKLLGELSNNPDDFVFDHSTLGNSAREWLKKNWNETLKNAKIEAHSRTPYTTRHTFVSLASSSKVNPLLISDTVGHSGLKMIEEAYGSIDRSNEDFEDFSSMVEQQIQIENQL